MCADYDGAFINPSLQYRTQLDSVYYHSRKIGPRTHVWSEKEIVDQAAWEFDEVLLHYRSYFRHFVWTSSVYPFFRRKPCWNLQRMLLAPTCGDSMIFWFSPPPFHMEEWRILVSPLSLPHSWCADYMGWKPKYPESTFLLTNIWKGNVAIYNFWSSIWSCDSKYRIRIPKPVLALFWACCTWC